MLTNTYLYEYYCESYHEYLNSEPIITQKDDNESILYDDDDFTVCSVPPNDFCSQFRWKCYFKNSQTFSIRELADLEKLQYLKSKLCELLTKHNITHENACMYFSYFGKSSNLILNIADISNGTADIQTESKFIYFDDLLKNLLIDLSYYKRDISYIKKSLSKAESFVWN